jgi:hypothetical protein
MFIGQTTFAHKGMYAPALLAIVGLGLKGRSGANTLAYIPAEQMTNLKSYLI